MNFEDSNTEDAELLPTARANHARRKFQLTLAELCLKAVAKNETFYATCPSQTNILENLVLDLKTRLLAELSRQVFNKPVHPASKHRRLMVRLLIHHRLRVFDFAACGRKFKRDANQKVWRCLAEKAGAGLRCVRDLRITKRTRSHRNLDWCLPFLKKMKNMEELRLTTLCCADGDLEALVEVVPRLRKLQLFIQKSFDPFEIRWADRLKFLEELDLSGKKVRRLIPDMLHVVPQLKINCLRTDVLYPHTQHIWHQRDETKDGPFDLEHCCVVLFGQHILDKFVNEEFSKVRHLMLTEPETLRSRRAVPKMDFTKHYRHLETLHFRDCKFEPKIQPCLRVNGNAISALILDAQGIYPDDKKVRKSYNIQWVLQNCKNLKSLTMRRAWADFNPGVGLHQNPLPNVENLSLKKLHLVDSGLSHLEFLGWLLLSAQLLEEVIFESFVVQHADKFATAKREVELGHCLTNLRSFKLSLYKRAESPAVSGALSFAKTVMAHCQNLQQASVELDEEKLHGGKHSLKTYLQLVNY